MHTPDSTPRAKAAREYASHTMRDLEIPGPDIVAKARAELANRDRPVLVNDRDLIKELADMRLPSDPVVTQAMRLDAEELEAAQVRRSRAAERSARDARRRADPWSVTVGDVLFFLGGCAIAVVVVACAYGFATGIDSWPALWGAK